MPRLRFHQYAWGLLAYNLAVILGGAFVRASISGDGCGAHWPSCNGQLIPEGGRLATMIEFGHRLSTGILLAMVIAFVIWGFRQFPKGHPVRAGVTVTLLMTIVEALIGAALVLFQWVAQDKSVGRAVAMPAHLAATFILLGAVALSAWWSTGGGKPRIREHGPLAWAVGVGLLATILLGISGAITALGDTLFPGHTAGRVPSADLSATTHFLIGLRKYHPIIAIATGLYLALLATMCMQPRRSARTQHMARVTVLIFATQMVAGFINYALSAPIWMQLSHLLLADLFWVSLVLLSAAALSEPATEAVTQPAVPVVIEPHPAVATATRTTWKDYLALTKPRVISLLLFTTLAAMVIAAGAEHMATPSGWQFLAVGLGLYMAAGAANAINMVLERDLDLRMGRTAARPVVTERITPQAALWFAVALMVGSFGLLWGSANLLAALLAQAGLAFYVIVYTLLLKRRTSYNIVIGGAAGAFPPLVGWAAVTGDLGPLAWVLFGIIFLWTPVHFWALALLIKDDYARAGVPMLPVVRGDRATVLQIGYYTLLTVAISALPLLLPGQGGQAAFGGIYLGTAVLLNAVLVLRAFQLYRHPDHPHARSLFKYSMVYLALLFLAMAVDRAPWS
jgi:heme o synthase